MLPTHRRRRRRRRPNQEGRGSTPWGGLPPPQTPPGDRANYTLHHPADVKTDLGLDFQDFSNFLNFQVIQEKAQDLSTSNRSKPIGVLTRNYRHLIPLYPYPRLLAARFSADFRQLFVCPPAAALTRKEGGRQLGGLPPPPKPPRGDRTNYTLRHSVDVKIDLGLDFQDF